MATNAAKPAGMLRMDEVSGTGNLLAVLAEGLATFAFVFLGPAAVVASGIVTDGDLDSGRLLAISFAHGFAILLLVSAFGRISGAHINPAVTFAALVTGKIGMAKAAAYVGAQLLGAVVGAYLLFLAVPAALQGGLGSHGLGAGFSEMQGLLVEVLLTFFLVWVVFAVAMDTKGPGFPIAPIAIGLVVLVDHLVGVPMTGASMNPARTFGPALLTGNWDAHWIYWVGPLLGGAAAGLLYQLLYGRNRE